MSYVPKNCIEIGAAMSLLNPGNFEFVSRITIILYVVVLRAQ